MNLLVSLLRLLNPRIGYIHFLKPESIKFKPNSLKVPIAIGWIMDGKAGLWLDKTRREVGITAHGYCETIKCKDLHGFGFKQGNDNSISLWIVTKKKEASLILIGSKECFDHSAIIRLTGKKVVVIPKDSPTPQKAPIVIENDRSYKLADVPNYLNYSDEPLRRLKKKYGDLKISTKYSVTDISLAEPGLYDDRVSIPYKGFTIQGPFICDDSERYVCCTWAWQGVDGLIILDLNTVVATEIGYLTGMTKVTATPIAFKDKEFIVLIGGGQISKVDIGTGEVNLENNAYNISISDAPNFIVTKNGEKPTPIMPVEPDYYEAFLVIISYGAKLNVVLNEKTLQDIEPGSTQHQVKVKNGGNSIEIKCLPLQSSFGYNLEVVIRKMDYSTVQVFKKGFNKPEPLVREEFNVNLRKMSAI